MKKWRSFYFIIVWLSTFLFACSPINSVQPFDAKQAAQLAQPYFATKPAQQMIRLDLPNAPYWKKYTDARGKRAFFPLTESPTHWSQCIQTAIQLFTRTPNRHIQPFVQADIEKNSQDCAFKTIEMLTETPGFVVYQLTTKQCANQKNQRRIAKAFRGRDAFYLIDYTALLGSISESQFDMMAGAIRSSQLVSYEKGI